MNTKERQHKGKKILKTEREKELKRESKKQRIVELDGFKTAFKCGLFTNSILHQDLKQNGHISRKDEALLSLSVSHSSIGVHQSSGCLQGTVA